MTDDYAHVDEAVRPLISLSPRERAEYCHRPRWVPYEMADTILASFADLYNRPISDRTENYLLYGESGNGKSSILREFMRQHPVIMDEESGMVAESAVYLTVSSDPSVLDFWESILQAMCIGYGHRDSVREKRKRALEMLRFAHVKTIILDEFQNFLLTKAQTLKLLACIRDINIEACVPIIAAGNWQCEVTINRDAHLKTRFDLIRLPEWTPDKKWSEFVSSFESTLPFRKPSFLWTGSLAERLYELSGPILGNTVKIIKRAAAWSAMQDHDTITEAAFGQLQVKGYTASASPHVVSER